MADLAALSVLIVDDHEAMRALLRKVLERAGFGSIRDASKGGDALRMLASEPAHLILADRNMPEGAGFIDAVRAQGSVARIITITGDARAEAGGADALLVKPVSPRDLLATIERVLSA